MESSFNTARIEIFMEIKGRLHMNDIKPLKQRPKNKNNDKTYAFHKGTSVTQNITERYST